MGAGSLMGEVGTANVTVKRSATTRPGYSSSAVARPGEPAQAGSGECRRNIGRGTEKAGKGRNLSDILALRLFAEGSSHPDPAAAKIADLLVAHRRLLC
jgi:hypothetical protein